MPQHFISVDSAQFALADGRGLDELKTLCAAAVASEGAHYVDFLTVQNSTVSVLLTSRSQVSFSSLENAAPVMVLERDQPSVSGAPEQFGYWESIA